MAAKDKKPDAPASDDEAPPAKPGKAPDNMGPGSATPVADHAALAAEAKKKGEKTVTMMFPTKVRLTLQDHRSVDFPVGLNEVPESLADHWYLKANKVVEK